MEGEAGADPDLAAGVILSGLETHEGFPDKCLRVSMGRVEWNSHFSATFLWIK